MDIFHCSMFNLINTGLYLRLNCQIRREILVTCVQNKTIRIIILGISWANLTQILGELQANLRHIPNKSQANMRQILAKFRQISENLMQILGNFYVNLGYQTSLKQIWGKYQVYLVHISGKSQDNHWQISVKPQVGHILSKFWVNFRKITGKSLA